MPAIILVKRSDNNVPDSPRKWLAGEIVEIFEEDRGFGWYDIPVKYQGALSITAMNALTPANTPADLYKAYTVTDIEDTATITVGTKDCTVLSGDVVVWMFGQFFQRFGPRQGAPQNFYHIRVSDKAPEEIHEYTQQWGHRITISQISNVGDDRRLEVTSAMVSATGKNAFTQSWIEDNVLSSVAVKYPSVSFVSNTDDTFQFDITIPLEDRSALIRFVGDEIKSASFYKRRQWGITPAGLAWLGTQGGFVSVTAAELQPHLRNWMLE